MSDERAAASALVAKMRTTAPMTVSPEQLESALERSELTLGRCSVTEIVPEVMPMIESLVDLPALASNTDLGSFEFRESFALITLLGRRLALLDLTPTAALGVCSTAIELVPTSKAFADSAVAACMEGFVRGREERIDVLHNERAEAAVRPVRVSADCFLLMPSGIYESQLISDKVDELARKLFEANAKFAIVDFSQMGEASAERAAALFGADEMAKMLGACCIFTGLNAEWKAAAREVGIQLDLITTATDLAEGIVLAHSGGDRDKRDSWLRELWERISGSSDR